jgi:hypothetical protein
MIKTLKLFLTIFFIGLLTCCQSISSKKNKKTANQQSKIKDGVSFLGDCEKVILSTYIGTLQGTKHSNDSTGLLCFFPCYEGPNTYESILMPRCGVDGRALLGLSGLEKELHSACSNNFSSFDCFVFVLPLQDPEKQDDIHALNMNFPVSVKIYSRGTNGIWHYIKTARANSFQEYSNLQFNTIYSL